jgi:rhamnogalacturonyl hydrolase YesR
MKKTITYILFALLFHSETKAFNADSVLTICKSQMEVLLANSTSTTSYPRTLNAYSAVTFVGAADWTSGFFPGSLWYLGEYFKNTTIKSKAASFTNGLSLQQYNTSTHDVGFVLYCSYGNGYRINNDATSKEVLINTANSLMTRYNPTVGCTRSWSFGAWSFPVIIDNMMNLELLFWATRATGDSTYYKAAVSHANRAMKELVRSDYTSYHLVDFDPNTGEVLKRQTFQGAFDESVWARGQGWELYGFTMCYRETGDVKYLELARNITNWIKTHLPSDYVPYWDYLAPLIPNEPKDASAAAVYASALLELSTLDKQNSKEYFDLATSILENLSKPTYLASGGANKGFILKHCTGNKPAKKEIDVPLNYGDYYFIEALTRYPKAKAILNSINSTSAEKLRLQSNIVRNNLTILGDEVAQIKELTIFEMNGKAVLKSASTSVNLETLPSGNYILRCFTTKGRSQTLRFYKL